MKSLAWMLVARTLCSVIVSVLPKEITVSVGFVVLGATLLASQALSVAAVTIDDSAVKSILRNP